MVVGVVLVVVSEVEVRGVEERALAAWPLGTPWSSLLFPCIRVPLGGPRRIITAFCSVSPNHFSVIHKSAELLTHLHLSVSRSAQFVCVELNVATKTAMKKNQPFGKRQIILGIVVSGSTFVPASLIVLFLF